MEYLIYSILVLMAGAFITLITLAIGDAFASVIDGD